MDDLIDQILQGSAPTSQPTKVVEAHTKVTTKVEMPGKVTHDEKILETKMLDVSKSPPVYLSIKYSSTIPLGEYRMCKVEKGLFIPIGIEVTPGVKAQIDKTNEWAKSTLEQLMQDEVKIAMAEYHKNKSQESLIG